MMRSRLKQLAEHAFIRSGLERFTRKRQHDRVLVLAYHNVLPEGERQSGDMSLHLPLDDFIRQLDVIQETHDVVSLESVLEFDEPGSRPRVAITFDDAYAGALTSGVPELARRGLPATVFVAPGILGSTTWWDILADPAIGEVPQAKRSYALDSLSGRQRAVLAWAGAEAESRGGRLQRIATGDELKSAAAYPGLALASHTWSHPDLTSIATDDIDVELADSLHWLRERFSNVLPWLSYPYGRCNSAVESAVRSNGYSAAFRVEGGWVNPAHRSRPTFIPRFNVPAGISIEGFRLRLAGLISP
jgi:peptidoglycan/xylan/chitin deacetylase (PgdA/CDA1 family)